MILPVVDYYEIKDISGEKKNLTVLAEYDNRREAEEALGRLTLRGCEVYGEHGELLYRIVCSADSATSQPSTD